MPSLHSQLRCEMCGIISSLNGLIRPDGQCEIMQHSYLDDCFADTLLARCLEAVAHRPEARA